LHYFCARVTSDKFARLVERSEVAVEISSENDVVGVLEQVAITLFALAQGFVSLLALGYVARNGENLLRRAPVVPIVAIAWLADQPCVALAPDVMAVFVAAAIGHILRGRAFEQR